MVPPSPPPRRRFRGSRGTPLPSPSPARSSPSTPFCRLHAARTPIWISTVQAAATSAGHYCPSIARDLPSSETISPKNPAQREVVS
ncbi:hypothetical protein DAI22_06g183103 [Oryza sativa Japonica Group]|nr:hypothetical protein DAI22_06g183103 [Oryza sativa Japonica Group]